MKRWRQRLFIEGILPFFLINSKEFKFPICDNPILMYGRSSFLLPTSPKHLLKVEMDKPVIVNIAAVCCHKKLPLPFYIF